MEEKKFYPTRADLVVKDVSLSSARGQQLAEVIGLWQFVSWEDALKILEVLRSARKTYWEAQRQAPPSPNPSAHEMNW